MLVLARGLSFDLVVLLDHSCTSETIAVLALHRAITKFPNELPKDKLENTDLSSPSYALLFHVSAEIG
jgi:hypothetical protein